MKIKVLILCTGNSCRSQMAEGVLRHYGSDTFEVASAGTKPSKANENAIQVMKEIGIDICNHRSKNVSKFLRQHDYGVRLREGILPGLPRQWRTASLGLSRPSSRKTNHSASPG